MVDEYDAVLNMLHEGGMVARCLVGEAVMQDLSGEESLAYILAACAELQDASVEDGVDWMRARIDMHNEVCLNARRD